MTDQQESKRAVGYAAAQLVKEGMKVGLGTGSTARYFIDFLGKRVREGLQIQAVASSESSYQQGKSLGIPLLDASKVEELDLYIDGADEIDSQKCMIKGGGGALFREKILAYASQEMVVIVDESKCVSQLGAFPLPVEVLPFGLKSTQKQIEALGMQGTLRQVEQREYQTDNGNFILDLEMKGALSNPEKIHSQLLHIPGVVETGLFCGIAGRVLIGRKSGEVELLP